MIKNLSFLTLILLLVSCNYNLINKWENYDESDEIKTNAKLENKRLQFKRIELKFFYDIVQSHYLVVFIIESWE